VRLLVAVLVLVAGGFGICGGGARPRPSGRAATVRAARPERAAPAAQRDDHRVRGRRRWRHPEHGALPERRLLPALLRRQGWRTAVRAQGAVAHRQFQPHQPPHPLPGEGRCHRGRPGWTLPHFFAQILSSFHVSFFHFKSSSLYSISMSILQCHWLDGVDSYFID
jgi:hypothetical protein